MIRTLPAFDDVIDAASRIQPYIHRTPVLTCRTLNKLAGAEIFLKAENFQKVGAFKARGACNAVFALAADEAQRGVATHSSGNHAQAIAYAAGLRGIPAIVVMPEDAPPVKVAAVRDYGAEIVWAGATPLDRERTLEAVLEQTGAVFIHPSNNFHVIAGQGTAALELLQDVPDLDIVMTPVGGGGLLAGTTLSVKALSPRARIIGAEPETVDDAARSLRDGCIYPPTNEHTIADGLRTFLGDVNFPIIREHVSAIVTVSEAGIIAAMRLIWERLKIIIEPSAAVPVAAVFEHPDVFREQRVGVILSGGNVDVTRLPW
ncbi:MAG TPA: pyridoxal-phosphate dependent enzyme [Anaerolineae bacterium]|nr:pyridoxal-phosphate dependent enzyme [Anaerolineae bacterium]HQI86582.1 pyridoxal-phosphate dependent enzyme [Anaerolineae bacterium]